MATAYSPEYLAESRTTVLNVFYSIPIPLEILSTAFRLWVKARPSSQGHLAFDDYLMIWATVRLECFRKQDRTQLYLMFLV